VAARDAVAPASLEIQRELLDRLRVDVESLRADLRTAESTIQSDDADARTAGAASSIRSRADRLSDEANAAEARITDALLRTKLRTDVIDVVATFRDSTAYRSALVPAGALAQDHSRR
jgi:hypothetical protein